MDLLFQRYASPFSFIDGMIDTGQFSNFVVQFVDTVNKENEEKNMWEFYLHRVFDKSFNDFKEETQTNIENQKMTPKTIETTVKNSLDILNNFNPEKNGGEKQNGIV